MSGDRGTHIRGNQTKRISVPFSSFLAHASGLSLLHDGLTRLINGVCGLLRVLLHLTVLLTIGEKLMGGQQRGSGHILHRLVGAHIGGVVGVSQFAVFLERLTVRLDRRGERAELVGQRGGGIGDLFEGTQIFHLLLNGFLQAFLVLLLQRLQQRVGGDGGIGLLLDHHAVLVAGLVCLLALRLQLFDELLVAGLVAADRIGQRTGIDAQTFGRVGCGRVAAADLDEPFSDRAATVLAEQERRVIPLFRGLRLEIVERVRRLLGVGLDALHAVDDLVHRLLGCFRLRRVVGYRIADDGDARADSQTGNRRPAAERIPQVLHAGLQRTEPAGLLFGLLPGRTDGGDGLTVRTDQAAHVLGSLLGSVPRKEQLLRVSFRRHAEGIDLADGTGQNTRIIAGTQLVHRLNQGAHFHGRLFGAQTQFAEHLLVSHRGLDVLQHAGLQRLERRLARTTERGPQCDDAFHRPRQRVERLGHAGGTLGDGADKRAHGTQSGRERAAERARQLAHHARQIGEHGARVTHRVKHLAEPVADTGTEIADSTTGLLQHAAQPGDGLAYDLARVAEHRASGVLQRVRGVADILEGVAHLVLRVLRTSAPSLQSLLELDGVNGLVGFRQSLGKPLDTVLGLSQSTQRALKHAYKVEYGRFQIAALFDGLFHRLRDLTGTFGGIHPVRPLLGHVGNVGGHAGQILAGLVAQAEERAGQ